MHITADKARLAAHWIRQNLVLCVSLALFLLMAFFLTGTTCVFRSTIGIPCPGCGLSRSMLAAMQMQWRTAFRFHPLFWLPPLMLISWLIIKLFPAVAKSRFVSKGLVKHGLFAAGILFVVVYLFRMWTFFPDIQPMVYQTESVIGRIWTLLRQILS